MTIAEIITVLLGIHSAHINVQLYFVASVKVRLKCGVYCFSSWTVPASSQMFADAKDQLLSQFWEVSWMSRVKKDMFMQTGHTIIQSVYYSTFSYQRTVI
jgi:hypothetical protein